MKHCPFFIASYAESNYLGICRTSTIYFFVARIPFWAACSFFEISRFVQVNEISNCHAVSRYGLLANFPLDVEGYFLVFGST